MVGDVRVALRRTAMLGLCAAAWIAVWAIPFLWLLRMDRWVFFWIFVAPAVIGIVLGMTSWERRRRRLLSQEFRVSAPVPAAEPR